jgi:hypothetical protein
MTEDKYLSARVDDQIDWYDRKSQSAQKNFKQLRGCEIIAAALIPLIAGFAEAPFPVTLIVGILGACIAIIAAFISLNQYQENWIGYRTICETMKHEKYLFLTKVAPYHQQDAFALFVQRIEGLVSKENTQWSKNIQANIQKNATTAQGNS